MVIMLYFGDHPPLHVHIRVGRPGHPGVLQASFAIDTGGLISGMLPTTKATQITRWCQRNQDALQADWERMQRDNVDEEIGTIAWPGGADLDPDVIYAAVNLGPNKARINVLAPSVAA
jgi:hypothetical protein